MLDLNEVTTKDVAGTDSRAGQPTITRPKPRPVSSLRATMGRSTAVVLGCLGAAVAATWPLALNLTTGIPEGTEHEATVSLFSLWGLWWTADRAAHWFVGYWDAPFFHPAQGVTTFSEPFPLVGLAVAPLWGLGLPPALIYNSAFLGLLTLNGLFAYRLARALGVGALPSLVGGLMAVTMPFVAKVEGAFPLVAVFGVPWTMEGLVRFGQTGSRRWAVWAATGLLATYLTCQQYALLFGPLALAGGVVALSQQGFAKQPVLRLCVAGLGAGILLAFVALPGLRVHAEQGFHRSEDLVQALSARPGDFMSRPELATAPLPAADGSDTAGLFPGAIVLVLAAVGAVSGMIRRATRTWTLYLIGGVVVSVLMAMALNVSIGPWQPFATLRAVVPGMSELRSPTRASAIAQLFLVMLAVLGICHSGRKLGRTGLGVLLVIGVVGAAENLSVPARLAPVPVSLHSDWTDWVRTQPDDTVIAHVPFAAGLHVSDYEIEARRMVAQIEHHKAIVNGYSGNFPQARTPLGMVVPIYTQFQLAMTQQFPSEQLLCIMDRGLDVSLLVVDRDWLSAHAAQMDAYAPFLEPAYADDQVQIYRLRPPVGKCS